MLDAGAVAHRWRNTAARRPALPLAIALIIGIAGEPFAPAHPAIWLIIATALLLAAIFTRKSWPFPILILFCTALAGLAAAELETFYFQRSHVAHFTTDAPRLAQLELRVASPPRLLTQAVLARPLPPRQVCRATVTRIRTTTGWQTCTGDVNFTSDQPHPQLAIGQTIRATGMLQRPMPATNPGQMDWAEFYRNDGILATFTVPHADAIQIIREAPFNLAEWLRAKVRHLLAAGFSPERSSDFALLEALTLGDRDAAMHDAQDDFSHSGTAYLLAVSGLHVVFVCAAALLLFGRLLGLRPRRATLLTIICVALYFISIIPSVPAVRATLLCAAYCVNRLSRRRPDGLQLLSLCAIAILLYHPHDLFSVGFQLSFAAVAGIILASRRIATLLRELVEDEHTRVARSFRPPRAFQAALLNCRNGIIDVLAMSIVAWLVLLPLTMLHFNQTNPWATVAGLLALPLVVAALMGGLLKILLTLALPSLAGTWAHLSWLTVAALRHWIHWMANWPGAHLTTPAPANWLIVTYYILVAVPMLPWTWRWSRRGARCAPAIACCLVLLPALVGATKTNHSLELRVTLLSIGAGQVGVIELPNGHAVLIDDGSDTVANPLHDCLAPYLNTRGIRAIDTIILSHPDYDHISAAADTAEMFHAAKVIISPVFRTQSQASEPAVAMLDRFDAMHIPIEITSKGQHVSLGNDAALDVLWPPPNRYFTTTNNAGLVLRLTYAGRSILFPADIQVPTERELLASRAVLRSDVLVAPHHGSAEETTAAFLAAVHPADVISSNAQRLSKKQKEFDALAKSCPLYRTSRFGAITVRISNDGSLHVETFLHPTK